MVSKAYVTESNNNSSALNDAYGYLWWLGKPGHYVLPSSSTKPSGRREGNGKAIAAVDDDAVLMLGADGQFAIGEPRRRLLFTRMGEGTGDPSGKLQAQDISELIKQALLSP